MEGGQESFQAAVSSKSIEYVFITLSSEENIALLKPATMSDILWSYRPALAVDGDSNTCSFTTRQEGQRWRQVHQIFADVIVSN